MELFSPDDGSPKEETIVTEFWGGLPVLPFPRGTCCLARVLSTLSGPTSSKAATVSFSNSRTPAEKCTGARRWRAQYAGSVASLSLILAPETQETKGICGERRGSCATQEENSSKMGSIIGEWKAREVTRRRATTPSFFSSLSRASSAPQGPETTHR